MARAKTPVYIPSFEELNIGDTDVERRNAIASRYGSIALVKHLHHGNVYRAGKLSIGSSDFFYLERDGRKERVYFHDLSAVLVAL